MSDDADQAEPQPAGTPAPNPAGAAAGKPILMGVCFDGPMQCLMVAGLTIYLVLLYALLIAFQWSLWGQQPAAGKAVAFAFLVWKFNWVDQDIWYLMMVLSLGALGSIVHAGTSLAAFVGARKAERSWFVWYLMHPLIGSLLAMVLYLVLRGGLLTTAAGSGDAINKYGIAAFAALSGMFTKQATNKLSEVFDTLFKSSKSPLQTDNAEAQGDKNALPPPH